MTVSNEQLNELWNAIIAVVAESDPALVGPVLLSLAAKIAVDGGATKERWLTLCVIGFEGALEAASSSLDERDEEEPPN